MITGESPKYFPLEYLSEKIWERYRYLTASSVTDFQLIEWGIDTNRLYRKFPSHSSRTEDFLGAWYVADDNMALGGEFPEARTLEEAVSCLRKAFALWKVN